MLAKPRLALVALLVLLASACASTAENGPAPADQPETTVRVDNRRFAEVNVFVYRGSQRIRLGTVPGISSRVFTLPRNLVFGATALRFQIDPIGGRAESITQEITVTAGDEVVLLVNP